MKDNFLGYISKRVHIGWWSIPRTFQVFQPCCWIQISEMISILLLNLENKIYLIVIAYSHFLFFFDCIGLLMNIFRQFLKIWVRIRKRYKASNDSNYKAASQKLRLYYQKKKSDGWKQLTKIAFSFGSIFLFNPSSYQGFFFYCFFFNWTRIVKEKQVLDKKIYI